MFYVLFKDAHKGNVLYSEIFSVLFCFFFCFFLGGWLGFLFKYVLHFVLICIHIQALSQAVLSHFWYINELLLLRECRSKSLCMHI